VDVDETREWFAEYVRVFEACGRGASDDTSRLMDYYGVPLTFTTDASAVALMTEQEVLAAVHDQISGMRAAGYDRSETLDSETTSVNATTALHTAEFSRLRADGSEIGRLRATYLIVDSDRGRRISALAVHTA
jgi:hypothetical protein